MPHTKRILLIFGAFVLVAVLAVAVVALNRPRSVHYPPVIPPPACTGEISVGLTNDNMFIGVSYELTVFSYDYDDFEEPFVQGTLAAGQTTTHRFPLQCGTYSVAVSWNGGPWNPRDATVEGGRATNLNFTY